MQRILSVSWLAVAAAACDPAATATGQGGPLDEQQRSQLGETCDTSLHCAPGLRCLDGVCRAAQSSVLGEFYAAVGAVALGRGDTAAAIDAYTQAVNQYEADRVDPPADLLCAFGGALVRDRDDRTHAEMAARVLHKCVLGAPPGSALRATAMRHLARLVDAGLDPLLLARAEPADVYLTKQPALPPVDAVKVTAAPQGRAPRSRTFTGWMNLLASPKVKAALAPCWEAHAKATRQTELKVRLGLHYHFRLDEYDDFDRSLLDIVDATPVGGATPDAAACVRDALAPVADEFARTGPEATWRAVVDLTIGA
ncbi:MAG: hypothetical protein D6689_20240 [Deltaproteobacteria bacterium]|nr:MAG: hypothetical protein D6689_20240 [Deltaproteobacteria bacterium]